MKRLTYLRFRPKFIIPQSDPLPRTGIFAAIERDMRTPGLTPKVRIPLPM